MRPTRTSPISYREVPGRWPYVLNENLSANLGAGFVGSHAFMDNGVLLGHLEDDDLTIFAGYASDGASPYFGKFLGIRIGTPSHAKTAPGWFVHDFLYQFADLPCCPWTYAQADLTLYWLMRNEGSILCAPYHAGVTLFGGWRRRWLGGSSTVSCIATHR